LPLVDGKIKINGRIAYAAQQAWVYNGTVRDNIVFGKDYDEQRYLEVIRACALEKVNKKHFQGHSARFFSKYLQKINK